MTNESLIVNASQKMVETIISCNSNEKYEALHNAHAACELASEIYEKTISRGGKGYIPAVFLHDGVTALEVLRKNFGCQYPRRYDFHERSEKTALLLDMAVVFARAVWLINGEEA